MAYVLVASRIPNNQAEYLDSLVESGKAKDRADAIRKIIEERRLLDAERVEYQDLPYVQKRERLAPPPGPPGIPGWYPKFKMYHSPSKDKPKDPNEMTANKLAAAFEEEYRQRYGFPPVAIKTEIIETSDGLEVKASEDKGLEASDGACFVEDIPVVKIEEIPRESEESPRIIRMELPPILGGSSEDPEEIPSEIGDDSGGESGEDPEKIGTDSEGDPEEASEDSPSDSSEIIEGIPSEIASEIIPETVPEGTGGDREAEPPPVSPASPLLPPHKGYWRIGERPPDLSGWTEEEIRAYRRMFPDKH
jgi:hypothetical protein